MSVKVTKTSKKKSQNVVKAGAVKGSGELHPLQSLRSEIDALFDNVLSGWPGMRLTRHSFDMDHWREPFREPMRHIEDRFAALNKLSTRAEVKETDKAVTVTAELPGVAEADIDVTVTDALLSIRAEKKEETRKDEDNYHVSERHYGSIKRTFTLPDGVDVDKAKASFKDGVLSITVPKIARPKSATKKIPVKG